MLFVDLELDLRREFMWTLLLRLVNGDDETKRSQNENVINRYWCIFSSVRLYEFGKNGKLEFSGVITLVTNDRGF